MQPDPQPDEKWKEALAMLRSGKSPDQVKQEFILRGYSKTEAETIIRKIELRNRDRKRKRGFLMIGMGAGIVIAGFIAIVMLDQAGEPTNILHYAITSAGVVIASIGVITVFDV